MPRVRRRGIGAAISRGSGLVILVVGQGGGGGGGGLGGGVVGFGPWGAATRAEEADVARADGDLQVSDQVAIGADLQPGAGLVDGPADAAQAEDFQVQVEVAGAEPDLAMQPF